MLKKLILLTLVVSMISCKGGNKGPVLASGNQAEQTEPTEHVATIANQKVDVIVQAEEGMVMIAEILSNRKKYDGKTITVKGEVTKFNPGIMGKNWVHIQDGTEASGEYDLTITTLDEVKVGSQVVFTGKLALDRDFGYGYKYSTIMEEAKLKK